MKRSSTNDLINASDSSVSSFRYYEGQYSYGHNEGLDSKSDSDLRSSSNLPSKFKSNDNIFNKFSMFYRRTSIDKCYVQ